MAAVISIAVKNDGDRGYTSFVLLILELNLVVWVGYYSDRNAGNAVKELEVRSSNIAVQNVVRRLPVPKRLQTYCLAFAQRDL